VPRRRVMELARYGMAGKATLLRRHPGPRKVATLPATVVHLRPRAIDDALELFDFLMVHELLASAQRTTGEETCAATRRWARAPASSPRRWRFVTNSQAGLRLRHWPDLP